MDSKSAFELLQPKLITKTGKRDPFGLKRKDSHGSVEQSAFNTELLKISTDFAVVEEQESGLLLCSVPSVRKLKGKITDPRRHET